MSLVSETQENKQGQEGIPAEYDFNISQENIYEILYDDNYQYERAASAGTSRAPSSRYTQGKTLDPFLKKNTRMWMIDLNPMIMNMKKQKRKWKKNLNLMMKKNQRRKMTMRRMKKIPESISD